MNASKKIIFTILIIVSGLTITYSLNYYMLNDMIIGNPNSYDTKNIETSTLFDIFYTISSDTGYRPEPSNMNFIFTFFVGLTICLFSSSKIVWGKKKNTHTPNDCSTK